jgi:hypothetical protein
MTKSITHSQEFYEKKRLATEKPTKICIKCGIEKSKSEFTTDRQHRDGKSPICNNCKKLKQKDQYKKAPDRFYKTVKGWIARNPEKRAAHAKISNAVRVGKIRKPNTCHSCGSAGVKLDAHHWKGYDDAHVYDVIWLCRSCHRKVD